jgi:nucleoside-diphosphate-sugar epimerase
VKKILVLGGTGFVGSRVVQTILDQGGLTVVATSRDGHDGTVAFDVLKESNVAERVKQLAQGCTAVISCIGAIGTKDDNRINASVGLAAVGAKAAGVERFVMLGVAPQVSEWASGIGPLSEYVAGKRFSREAAEKNFDAPVLIEPTFIYGGNEFGVNPPRVASFYGKIIDGLLSSAPFRGLEGIMPPGIIKIALEPPVSVDAVARAAVAGALGRISASTILDTRDKIQNASTML